MKEEQQEQTAPTAEERHTPTNPDAPRPTPTQSNPVRPPDWLTLDAVEQLFANQGLIRTRTLLARYCRQGRLTGVKDAGPNGDEWYVDPKSIPRAIAELKRIRRDEPSQTEFDPVGPGQTETDPTNASKEPVAARNTSKSEEIGDPDPVRLGQAEADRVRPSQPQSDLNIFEHPVVRRLEDEVKFWRSEYKDQVRSTQQIQQQSFEKLVELQRMVQVGQSKTLADFFIRTKEWMLGAKVDEDELEDDASTTATKRRGDQSSAGQNK